MEDKYDGGSFRINEEGSDPAYGFGYVGKSHKLYVFEAPIDFLSFITLYPMNWQDNSYVVLNGVAEHAILQRLKDYPYLDTVILCLDHDGAGIEACGRIKEILTKGTGEERPARDKIPTVRMLQSEYKDWNEDLKARNGLEPISAQELPKILECASWVEVMKEVCQDMKLQYATKEYLVRYYNSIYQELKLGLTKDNIETAFDGDALLLSGIAVKCVERFGREMGKETDSNTILDHLKKCYQPHRDKGNIKTKIRNLQQSFEEVMEVFDTKDLSLRENKELAAKKCMSLAMECVKAHIFCTCEEFIDTGDIHCLMIGAAGIGKTANFLYPNIEYACACGMSFLTTDTKGDLYRNYAGIAKKYYGYEVAVIDLRNPTRSDGDNMLHLVNTYIDQYLADSNNLSAKAKAEKYAKITAKTIISSGGGDAAGYGQNAFFYDAAEGILTAVILIIAEYCPKEKRHIVSVFKLIQDLMAPSKVKGKNQFQILMSKLPDTHKAKWFAGAAVFIRASPSLS